jgi:hypothetical protein
MMPKRCLFFDAFLFLWQCEQEYHVGCLKEHGLEDLKVSYSLLFFLVFHVMSSNGITHLMHGISVGGG